MSQPLSRSQPPATDEAGGSTCDARGLVAAAALLILAGTVKLLQSRLLRIHNQRAIYGIEHLPWALCVSAGICVAGALYLPLLQRHAHKITPRFALLSLLGASLLIWLPIVHASNLVADDWLLMAAATVRHSLAARPWLAWYALDSVDGNFRPLGTVVYLNHGFSVFGFYAGLLCCMLAVVLLYFTARRIGAQPRLALCAGLLFVSRDLLYGPIAWLCALGDDLVILFGAACILLLLISLRAGTGRAIFCHIAAFACLVGALLSKQSAYCLPPLALLTLALRPGQPAPARTARQWAVTLGASTAYLLASIAIFFHARNLAAGGVTPYPVKFTMDGIGYLLRSVLWYFLPVELLHVRGSILFATVVGALLLIVLLKAAWSTRGRLPLGDREFVFCVLAAVSSIALFIFLPTRRTVYYGDFAAYWVSLPVAALLLSGKRDSARGLAVIVALVVLGGTFAQLKRTALVPAGSYLAGTYEMDKQAAQYASLRQALNQNPDATTVIVIDSVEESFYPAMICTLPSRVQTIVTYNPDTHHWLLNKLGGRLPQDTPDAWTDKDVFHWNRPQSSPPALVEGDRVLTISAQ